jgi:cytochrome c oxidase subunit 2
MSVLSFRFSSALLAALPAIVPRLAYGDVQSVLHPRGENAAQIAETAWIMLAGGGAIFVAVMALAVIALIGTPAQRSALGRRAWIIGGGIIFPVVVLSALLIHEFSSASTMARADEAPIARIMVEGELWWWRVRYMDESGNTMVETANEIRIPADRPVEFQLTTSNVIHSFWVPNLAGKIDMIPGHVNRLRVQANAPGVLRGQCAEYCGAQHAKMAFHVVVYTPDEYDAWITAHTLPAQEPGAPLLQRGMQLFLQNGCGACHTIRGTPAAGKLGPDLTHIGSRLSIGAGVLPNSADAIAAWIRDSQHLKPENKMPAFNQFSGEELRALAAYLESLR